MSQYGFLLLQNFILEKVAEGVISEDIYFLF